MKKEDCFSFSYRNNIIITFTLELYVLGKLKILQSSMAIWYKKQPYHDIQYGMAGNFGTKKMVYSIINQYRIVNPMT